MDGKNGVLMQYFEWYLPESCGLWKQAVKEAGSLAEKGITAVWLPPAYKGAFGKKDVGYAVYDLFDLGEFNQKGSVATKYGTKEEYLRAIEAFQKAGMEVYADIVLNQMIDGDEEETVEVVECENTDREKEISGEETIVSRTVFTFPGRHGKYDDFTWNKNHFSGSDIDEKDSRRSIFLFDGSRWSPNVDGENGNFDYLLGLNVNFENPEVREHLIKWGKWYIDTCHMDGFRLDAVKHIDFTFFPEWLNAMREHAGKEMFAVGEYWNGDVNHLIKFQEETGTCMSLFDVPLHYRLHSISEDGENSDLRDLLNGTMTAADPIHSVLFVDNHDTQEGQALASPVQAWFVPQAYAFILLRQEGYPCIFYGDYYGLASRNGQQFREIIDRMLEVRKTCMTGESHDYFDDPGTVGWTFEGDETGNGKGFAAMITCRDGGTKTMYVGKAHAGETWKDVSGNSNEETVIDSDGNGTFTCPAGSLSFYIRKEDAER